MLDDQETIEIGSVLEWFFFVLYCRSATLILITRLYIDNLKRDGITIQFL